MSGIPDNNFPLFNKVAAELRAQGHFVLNPAEEDVKHCTNPTDAAPGGKSRREVLLRDYTWIMREADEIYMLPGWRASSGAVGEHYVARSIQLPVKYLRKGKPKPQQKHKEMRATRTKQQLEMHAKVR
jgi:hypothetical protein